MDVINLVKLNTQYEGTELCPHCGLETNFVFNPVKEEYIVCENCGEKLLPCSLCEQKYGCNYHSCKQNILETLNREVM